MTARPMEKVMHQLRQSALAPDGGNLNDGRLLDRFTGQRDEAAFAALVRRHGGLVWGVCRRLLTSHHDAEDAFQATFLVLARKASAIRMKELLANWLYGVAYQTARKARALAARRQGRERQVAEMPEPATEAKEPWDDLRPLLDRELSRLPDKYRVPIVLCDLEGKTRKEAAAQLGWPEGTVAGRLARGRQMLARRLSGRGVILTGGALAAALAQEASAAAPTAVVSATVNAAAALTAGSAVAGTVSAHVAALTEGVLKTMLLNKLKIGVAILAVMGILTGAIVGFGLIAGQEDMTKPEVLPAEEARKGLAEAEAQLEHAQAQLEQANTVLALAQANLQAAQAQYELAKANVQAAKKKVQGAAKKEKDAVWTLDFDFKSPKLLTVLGQGKVQKTVWYFCYEIINNTDQERTFIPDFELVLNGKAHHDQVLPDAQKVVSQTEDPAQALNIQNSVTIAAAPLPPAKMKPPAGSKGVHGVALWDDVNPDAKGFTLYITGLSNAWSVDGDTIMRKTLKLSFALVGKEMRPTGPAEWVYRSARLDPLKLKPLRFTEGGGYEWKGVFEVAGKAVYLVDKNKKDVKIKLADSWAEGVVKNWDKFKGHVVEANSWKDEEPLAFSVLVVPVQPKAQPDAGKADGLSARIEVKTKSPLAGMRLQAELVLTNDSAKPIRLCTFCGGMRSGDAGRNWYEDILMPDVWKDSPSPATSAKHVITLLPGKSVALPFSFGLIPNEKSMVTIKAGYAVGKEFAKQHDTWSGEVRAAPVIVQFAKVDWSGDHKDVKASELKIDLVPAAKVTRAKGGLVLPVKVANSSAKDITVKLTHEWHGGQPPLTDLYALVTPALVKKETSFQPVYLFGEVEGGSTKQVTISAGKSLEINLRMDYPGTGSVIVNPLMDSAGAGTYQVQLLFVFEADDVRQHIVSPKVTVELPAK